MGEEMGESDLEGELGEEEMSDKDDDINYN
jgi:hypothetical protein